ncbi:hypothetical protein VTN49DRAFT_7938 [Thermomyces lanuginosus]|uniref:uncharacterized protein n=1 Tax=Thermomyces lanuginosus TaxID=5541 RepID=UPI003744548A
MSGRSTHQLDYGSWREQSLVSPHGSGSPRVWERPQNHFNNGGSGPVIGERTAASGHQEQLPRASSTIPCWNAEATSTDKARRSGNGAGIPQGFERFLNPQSPEQPSASQPSQQNTTSRFRLHIRQQPLAARACAAGEKDRRLIDPPPIIQLLLVDFDPESESDVSLLRDPRFTVACLLYSVQQQDTAASLRASRGRNEEQEHLVHSSHILETTSRPQSISTSSVGPIRQDVRAVQVLSGRSYASPFHVNEEPDPATAPGYPTSNGIPACHDLSAMPATFFIFSDLSVRTAGLYRLQFRLMDWGSVVDTGVPQPILAETWSDSFRVYSSKDFPGMQKSSRLTIRLRELGFMELKPRVKRGRKLGGVPGKDRKDGCDSEGSDC